MGQSLFNVYLPFVYKNWPPPTPTPQPARLLISEVVYDPSGNEPDGEWFEIYNAGGIALGLKNHKIGDEELFGGNEGMLRFPDDLIIAPNQVIVIANLATTFFSTYGFSPDFEMRESDPQVPNLIKYSDWSGGNIELVNSGDEILILDPRNGIVDAISYDGSSFAFSPSIPRVKEGHSLERSPAYLDSNTAADWGDQLFPDPGQVDRRTPTPTITETPTQTNTNPDTYFNSHFKPDAYSNKHNHSHPHPDSNSRSIDYTHPHKNPNSHPHPNAHPDTNSYFHGHAISDVDAYSYVYQYSDTHAHSNPDGHAHTNA